MTLQTRPNRFKHGVLTVLEFAPIDVKSQKPKEMTKAQLTALEKIQKCLTCEMETCDEKLCRRK